MSALVFSIGGSVIVYFIAAALAGISYGLGSTIPMSLAITNWFNEKRGLAMGICSAGTGFCTVVFSPIITALVKRGGLKLAFIFQMVFMLVCAVIVYLLVYEYPKDKGLNAYGEAFNVEDCVKNSDDAPEESREISGGLWIFLCLMMLMVGGAGQAFNGHMSVLMTSCGYSVETAALAMSVFGLFLTIGKLIFGAVSDALGTKKATVLFIAVFVLGCMPSLWMDGKSEYLCYVFSFLLGLGAPIFALGSSLWALDLAGKSNYGETLRRFQMSYSMGGIVFSAVPGLIADRTGEYKSSYMLFAAMVVLSLLILLSAYRKLRVGSPQKQLR